MIRLIMYLQVEWVAIISKRFRVVQVETFKLNCGKKNEWEAEQEPSCLYRRLTCCPTACNFDFIYLLLDCTGPEVVRGILS